MLLRRYEFSMQVYLILGFLLQATGSFGNGAYKQRLKYYLSFAASLYVL